MNNIIICALLAFGVSSAFAQSATVTTSDEKGNVETRTPAQAAAAEKSADSFCLHETGSHLRTISHDRNTATVECTGAPGHAYTRQDIERTGAIDTGDALRQLDPSLTIRRH